MGKHFRFIIDYFYENQKFYRNAFKVIEQNSFNHYLFEHTKNLYMKIIDELSVSCGFSLSDETKIRLPPFIVTASLEQ